MIGKNLINPTKRVQRMPIIPIKKMNKLKKNISVGKIKYLTFLIYFFFTITTSTLFSLESKKKNFIELKILDKVSSKSILLKLKIGKEIKYNNLLIKSLKCKNSEFDDNPEITAYIQVQDLNNDNKDEVFVFNGWTFSSSPTINPFDHPVYNIWLTKCY